MADYSLDDENKRRYGAKAEEWAEKHLKLTRLKTDGKEAQKYEKSKNKPFTKGFDDVTKEWYEKSTHNANSVTDAEVLIADNGVSYKIDGHNVVLKYSEIEKRDAELLVREFSGILEMQPKAPGIQGLSTPDYIFNGKRYDHKAISKSGKNVIYNRLHDRKRQAENFVINVTGNELTNDEIKEQIAGIYQSYHTRFIDNIILIRDDYIVGVYSRKKA